MSANFKPVLSGITDLRPFRFWCQKVLPTVYEDSLSYYELLSKVVSYINTSIDNINATNENVQKLYDAYVLLEDYVNGYFDSADFQLFVDNKLDEMAQDGTLSAMVDEYLQDITSDILFRNDVNKEFTLNTVKLGMFDHDTAQIQGMTTDGVRLYACGTSGDTTQLIIYEINPETLVRTIHPVAGVYGHGNSADYCNGKIYLCGCMPTPNSATYENICIVDTTTWTGEFVSLPSNLKWWSCAMLKAYNNKYVLAGHRASSGVLDLFATIYGEPPAPSVLGLNKFLPWRSINIGAFSCDPASMCQYKNYILMGDAHLNTMYAKNCVRCFDGDGNFKANLYLPAMENNELEDMAIIGDYMYTCDISGNIYKSELTPVFNRWYESPIFSENSGAGLQFIYVNENGSENGYTEVAENVYVQTVFRTVPWFYPSKHWITGGSMRIRTTNENDLILTPKLSYTSVGGIEFEGTGKSGKALVYYKFVYSRTSDANEYIYTLTDFTCTAHYNDEEVQYTTLESAAEAGYFYGYNYIRNIVAEAMPRYTDTALTL